MYSVTGWKRKPELCVGTAEQNDTTVINNAIDLLEYQNDLVTSHYMASII